MGRLKKKKIFAIMINKIFAIKKVTLPLLIFGLILGVIRVYTAFGKISDYNTIHVKREVITKSVTASGEIKSEDEIELKFPVSGKLAYLAVKKNDKVNRWGYIGSLDLTDLQRRMEKSLIDYSKERNDFEEEWRVTYKGAQNPKDALTDTSRRNLEKNQLDLDKAVIDVELADIAKKNASLYSPIAGVVTKVHTSEGAGVLASTTPIVTVADLNKMVFIARIGEADIAEITLDQGVIITLDAFEGKKFTGKVIEIDYASTSSVNGGGKFYLVKIALDDLAKAKLDMSGEAEIIIQRHANALTIPQIAIQERGGKKYVEVLEGDEIKQKEITTGIRGTGGKFEVLSGLTEEEKVIIRTK